MIKSGFFNSMNGDRKYDASKFAEYFASFIGNGVFPDSLQVISNNNMTITVKSGKAWINGYILINDADYILNINVADGVLNRIDRIVLRYDVVDREIRLEVKQGTFAASPIAPALQRDADAYELCIANITVSAGSVSITQDKITDTRLNIDLCGKVDTLIAGDYLNVINAVNNKLDKTGDSKDNKVTFTEAAADADIASGDTHSTLFGKLLKNLNSLRDSMYNIVNGGTTVGKAVTLSGLLSTIAELNFVKGVTSAIQTQLNGKAPTNHASTGTGYGVGDASNYGHVKIRNDLAGTETAGSALSPAMGKALHDKMKKYTMQTLTTSGNFTVPANVYELDVFIINGGQGGDSGYTNASAYNGGRGGRGGKSGSTNIFKKIVTPGQIIPYVVGSGGSGGVETLGGGNAGSPGGISSFGDLTVANNYNQVEGGEYGVGGNGSNLPGQIGNPGNTRTTNFPSSLIAQFFSGAGGGGGGGLNSTGGTGGSSSGGGNGGKGGNSSLAGSIGSAATVTGSGGGGGGGAGGNAIPLTIHGANGGDGKSGAIYVGYHDPN